MFRNQFFFTEKAIAGLGLNRSPKLAKKIDLIPTNFFKTKLKINTMPFDAVTMAQKDCWQLDN